MPEYANFVSAFTEHLNSVKVVSFDVFDTLFVRLVEQPQAVFSIMAKRLNCPDFIKHRQQAQSQAFVKMLEQGRREITIEDIYNCLNIDGLDKHKAQSLEFDIELQITKINPQVAEMFYLAKKARKTIIWTSDMYLPENFFKQLAQRTGLVPDHFFISSDCNATKRDRGDLFKLIIDSLGVKAEDILHVGDNPVGDIARATAHGVKTLRYYPPIFNMPQANIHDPSQQICSGLSRYGAYQVNKTDWLRLGWQYGGPALYGFFNWININSKNNNFDKIVYVARDGFVLHQLHQLQFKQLSSSYLKGSRVAFVMATMNEQNFPQQIPFLFSGAEHLVLEELFERIGVDLPDESVLHDLGMHKAYPVCSATRPQVCKLLMALQHCILRVARQTRQGLYRYLHSLGIRDGMHIAMVDVGWSGSTQVAFEQALKGMFNCQVTGYYLALSEPAKTLSGKTGLAMRAMCESQGVSSSGRCQLNLNRVVVELFFSSPQPTVIGYRALPDRIDFVNDVERGAEYNISEVISEINNGIFQYIEMARSLSAILGLVPDGRFALENLIQLACQPNLEQVKLIGQIYNWDAWASSKHHRIYFSYKSSVKQSAYTYKPNLWPAGWKELQRQRVKYDREVYV